MTKVKERNIGSKVLSGFRWSFLLNIFQKIITFIINQFIIRVAGPDVFGIAAIQLELLLSTLLFLSREGLRLSALKKGSDSDIISRKSIILISWLPSLLLAFVCIIVYKFKLSWIHNNSNENGNHNDHVTLMYCFAACLEAMGEPWYNAYSHAAQPLPRLRAETGGAIGKSIGTLIILYIGGDALDAFSVGQLCYGFLFTLILISQTYILIYTNNVNGVQLDEEIEEIQEIQEEEEDAKTHSQQYFLCYSDFNPFKGVYLLLATPKSISSDNDYHDDHQHNIAILSALRDVLMLTSQTTFTSVIKHVITEADKLVLSYTTTAAEQGVFAVAQGYGSLVARMIFLPIEENSRIVFARAANTIYSDNFSGNNSNNSDILKKNKKEIEIENEKNKKEEMQIIQLASVLSGLVRVVLLLGLLAATFAPSYTHLLVTLLFHRKRTTNKSNQSHLLKQTGEWNDDTVMNIARTLGYYCTYLALLAINGVTEGFLHASTGPTEASRINRGLIVSSLTFTMVALLLAFDVNDMMKIVIGNDYNDNNSSISNGSSLSFGLDASGVVMANIVGSFVRVCWNLLHIKDCFLLPRRAFNNHTNKNGIKSQSSDGGSSGSDSDRKVERSKDDEPKLHFVCVAFEWLSLFGISSTHTTHTESGLDDNDDSDGTVSGTSTRTGTGTGTGLLWIVWIPAALACAASATQWEQSQLTSSTTSLAPSERQQSMQVDGENIPIFFLTLIFKHIGVGVVAVICTLLVIYQTQKTELVQAYNNITLLKQ